MGAPKGNQFAKGHGYGRPKEYTDAFIENEAKAFREWMQKPENIYFKSFAIERGYLPSFLTEFAKTNKVFDECLSYAHAWQEQKLANYGLFSKTNPSITKFVLQNCHGWTEKSQISGDAGNPLGFILQNVDGKTKDLIDESDSDSNTNIK